MLVQPGGKDRETKSALKKQESSGGITIPDMSNVFYQSSYDERVKKVTRELKYICNLWVYRSIQYFPHPTVGRLMLAFMLDVKEVRYC